MLVTDLNNYSPEVQKIFSLGKPTNEEIDYLELGLSQVNVSELIKIAENEEEFHNKAETEGEESLSYWPAIHAIKALGRLKASEAIETIIKLLREEPGTWASESAFQALVLIGELAIKPLKELLPKEALLETDKNIANYISEILQKIGNKYPETKEEIIKILSEQLGLYKQQDPELNASLISDLCDLKAVEAADLIQKAFEEECVAKWFFGDWYDAQVHLGLRADDEEYKKHKEEQAKEFCISMGPKFEEFIERMKARRLVEQKKKIQTKIKNKRKAQKKARQKNRK